MNEQSPRTQTVLITGASAGIGERLAHCFARNGYDLALVARNAEKLQALAGSLGDIYGVAVHPQSCDLSAPGAPVDLFEALQKREISVDILVNNAGLLEQGPFTDIGVDVHRAIIDLNVHALTELIAHFLPPMVARGSGRIMNIASTSAFQPVPWLASYAATKAFVLSLSESLSVELEGSGVTVTAFCPGYTSTDMMTDDMKKLPGFMIADAESVAQDGYEACIRGKAVRTPGLYNRAAAALSGILPRWLVRHISSTIGRPDSV